MPIIVPTDTGVPVIVPSDTPPLPTEISFSTDFADEFNWPIPYEITGNYAIVDGSLTSVDGLVWLILGEVDWTNYMVEADFLNIPGSCSTCPKIAIHYKNSDNYYGFHFRENLSRWYIYENGKKTSLGLTGPKFGDKAKMIIYAQNGKIWVKDYPEFSHRAHLSGKVALLITKGLKLDNLKILSIH